MKDRNPWAVSGRIRALLAFRDRYTAEHPRQGKPGIDGFRNYLMEWAAYRGKMLGRCFLGNEKWRYGYLTMRRRRMKPYGKYKHLHWCSPIRIPNGLGILLAGFLSTPGKSSIHATLRGHKKQVVFIQMMWDFCLLNPNVLVHWAKIPLLDVECEKGLAYWDDWEEVVRSLRATSPLLWHYYGKRADSLQGFRMSLKKAGK